MSNIFVIDERFAFATIFPAKKNHDQKYTDSCEIKLNLI